MLSKLVQRTSVYHDEKKNPSSVSFFQYPTKWTKTEKDIQHQTNSERRPTLCHPYLKGTTKEIKNSVVETVVQQS